MQAICARDEAKARAFADKWGWESVETDWRKLVETYVDVINAEDKRKILWDNAIDLYRFSPEFMPPELLEQTAVPTV